MNAEMYKDILINNLSGQYADNLQLAWIFQQENDPKHTSKIVKSWLNQEAINVLHWPPQSPDLNPTDTLRGILKQVVGQKKPATKNDLWRISQEEWKKITPQQCARLVDSMPKRCSAVIKQKGHPTQY